MIAQPLHWLCHCHFKSNSLLSYYKNLLRDYFTIRFFLCCYALIFQCSCICLMFFISFHSHFHTSPCVHCAYSILSIFCCYISFPIVNNNTLRLFVLLSMPYLFINFITTRIIIARSFRRCCFFFSVFLFLFCRLIRYIGRCICLVHSLYSKTRKTQLNYRHPNRNRSNRKCEKQAKTMPNRRCAHTKQKSMRLTFFFS